jgi:hypothetical protein
MWLAHCKWSRYFYIESKLMEKLEISPTRRVRGLGSKQRAALIAEFAAS